MSPQGRPQDDAARSGSSAGPRPRRPQLKAQAPDRLWVADITDVPTMSGFLYLDVALDVFSRRIVGWSMQSHLRTELIVSALDMAVGRRGPKDVMHHSDQGCRNTSLAFGSRRKEAGSAPRWAPSETPTATPGPRVSSRPWKANCWTGAPSLRRPRLAWPGSPASKVSTTRCAGTPASAIDLASTAKRHNQQAQARATTSLPEQVH
ncbi:hypothetical protein D3273_23200 [Lichenibacterium minor]|uniref:Integrase catalytic domain-containing protein n=1 Tax=Lichenibacterium minor TaxID=2316528 RepID=A0A4Q2U4A8_9HYPH|nr:hypothetical protein D3273_23200 [Lichenibacterium minor]